MTAEAIEGAVQAGRAAMILEHIKNNNIAYLLGILVSYQMGILDQVFAHGTTICG